MNAPTELPVQRREATLTRAKDGDAYDLTFSSELAVRRWYGFERLSHAPGAANLERAEAGMVNVLDSHAPGLQAVLGRVQRAWIGNDRRGHAIVGFADTERGREARQLVDSGMVRGVSVGYSIDQMREAGTDEASGEPIYEAARWTVVEVSLTHSPMDASVGVGRAREGERTYPVSWSERMDNANPQGGATATRSEPAPAPAPAPDPAKAERDRIAAMVAYGRKYPEVDGPALAARAIEAGQGINELMAAINAASHADYKEREEGTRRSAVPITNEWRDTHATFSFQRAIIQCCKSAGIGFDRAIPRVLSDGPEREIAGYEGGDRFRIPGDVLRTPYAIEGYAPRRGAMVGGTRALLVDSGTNAVNLVADDYLAGSFIELLRNASAIMPYVTTLSDLVGDIEIPRQTSAATAEWLPETSASDMATSEPDFDQLPASPKEVGSAVRFSRKTLIQASPDIEMLVRSDLASVISLALDYGALDGTGANNQPLGVMRQPNIHDASFGADANNGAAPSWANVIEMAAMVLGANAISLDPMRESTGAGLFVGNAATWKKLTTTPKVTGDGSAGFLLDGGRIGPFGLSMSNQLAGNLTKGTHTDADLSAFLFGKLSDILVLLWSGVDIEVDAATERLRRLVTVSAFQDADVLIRHPESFAVAKDVVTT